MHDITFAVYSAKLQKAKRDKNGCSVRSQKCFVISVSPSARPAVTLRGTTRLPLDGFS
jgi:hypothetical protein